MAAIVPQSTSGAGGLAAAAPALAIPAGTPNTLTFHGDAGRSGFDQNETVLTPANVAGGFGQVWQSPVLDGHLYASPLYMDNVSITSGGNPTNGGGVQSGSGQTMGVVFAATGGGSVYAIKAFDTSGPTGIAPGTILWKSYLGAPSASIDGNSIGVLGTPIIDARANRLYVVASVTDDLLPAADPNSGKRVFEVFALDLGNGAVLPGWPLVIDQAVLDAVNQNNLAGPGAGSVVLFGPATSGGADERGALNLSADGGSLYVPFASYGSSNGGWLLVVATGVSNGIANGQAPAVLSAYSMTDSNTTAPGNGGIWGAGGPAIDSSGNVFVSTGDAPGGTKQTPGSWGNSVVEFAPGQSLTMAGVYTPWNYQTQDTIDTDLGGAAPVIISLKPGSSATTELLASGGKQGNAYLVDAGNHLNDPSSIPGSPAAYPADLTTRPPVVAPNQDPSLYDPNAIRPYFSPPQAGPLNVFGPYSERYGMGDYGRSRTTPATFVGPDGTTYVVWTGSSKIAEGSTIPTAPSVVVTKVVAAPGQNAYLAVAARNTQTMSTPGASLITANGTAEPIVWVVDIGVQRTANLSTGNYFNGAPTLYAYDALTMQPLWSSAYKQLDIGGKYNTITVARGVLFAGTDRIQAFGLTGDTIVDDSVMGTGVNQFSYVGGGWSHTPPGTSTSTMGTFQGTVSTDNQAGDYATMTFSGSQIKVFANEMAGYGTAAISLDGGAATNVSLANATNSPNGQGEGDVPIYTASGLGPGLHTLTVMNTANTTIALDRVEITPLSTAAALEVSATEGNVAAVAGQALLYTINYDNAGSMTDGLGNLAAGVVLTETVPANTTFNSAASTAGWTLKSGNGSAGSTYAYAVGNLAAGDSGSVVFAVSVNGSIPSDTSYLSDAIAISDSAGDSNTGTRLTPIGVPMASKVAFSQLPGRSLPGLAIAPAVTVVVQDQFGSTMTSDDSTVTLTLSGGTFAGGANTVSAPVVGGVATFSNLVIPVPGRYTLTAADGTLRAASSSPFYVEPAAVMARNLFYNDSVFDGYDSADIAADGAAIAPDKLPLLPGQTASFANVSSYFRGINGIIVDVSWLPIGAALTAADFSFKAGAGPADPSTWADAPAPSVTALLGAGVGGSDRIELLWPDNAIQEQWLQVTVKATTNTGLNAPDVFYFGSLIGETGNDTAGTVLQTTVADIALTKSMSGQTANIASVADFNRSGQITVADVAIAKAYAGHALILLNAPPALPPQSGSAALSEQIKQRSPTSAAATACRTRQDSNFLVDWDPRKPRGRRRSRSGAGGTIDRISCCGMRVGMAK
jgi:uncharacterized repeat protein (TIGR01451 family)